MSMVIEIARLAQPCWMVGNRTQPETVTKVNVTMEKFLVLAKKVHAVQWPRNRTAKKGAVAIYSRA